MPDIRNGGSRDDWRQRAGATNSYSSDWLMPLPPWAGLPCSFGGE